MAGFGLLLAVFGTIALKVQDDRRYAGVSDEGRCSFMAIGLSKDGKWVFNKGCTTPWCHAVVNFEVKTSRF